MILKKSGLSKEEFEILFSLITDSINIVEKGVYDNKINEADELIGHVDKGDVPFLALAFSIPCNGIWTNNVKHFNVQDKVKIWDTYSIMEHLEKFELK